VPFHLKAHLCCVAGCSPRATLASASGHSGSAGCVLQSETTSVRHRVLGNYRKDTLQPWKCESVLFRLIVSSVLCAVSAASKPRAIHTRTALSFACCTTAGRPTGSPTTHGLSLYIPGKAKSMELSRQATREKVHSAVSGYHSMEALSWLVRCF